jgi:PhnB protein
MNKEDKNMITASPFVVVENCKDELKYYQSIFGGEIKILREHDNRALNAELHFEGTMISFAEVNAAKPSVKGDYVKVILKFDSEEEIWKAYNTLTVGGQIIREMYESPAFDGLLAMVTDRNGIGWVLSHKRD